MTFVNSANSLKRVNIYITKEVFKILKFIYRITKRSMSTTTLFNPSPGAPQKFSRSGAVCLSGPLLKTDHKIHFNEISAKIKFVMFIAMYLKK